VAGGARHEQLHDAPGPRPEVRKGGGLALSGEQCRQGNAAETAAGLVIMVATWLKAPVSTTHVISASIMGVGASKRVSAVRWGVAKNMLVAWVLTIPIAALVSAIIYWLLRLMIGS
jgi:phosphate/sulfate permease